MNTVASIVVSILAGSATAVGVTLAMQPADTSTDSLLISQLESSLQKTWQANAALSARLDELAQRPSNAVAPASIDRREASIVSAEQVAAAVEVYLSNRGGKPLDAAAGSAADAMAFDLDEDLRALLGASFFEDPDAWKRAFEAGKMDEVIAEIEALAKANPNDPESQMNLANAYMAYLQMDNTKWDMSMKADGQFDKVLALDENHWEARFTKAVSYTFWPPFLGKGKDAISQFERLIKQQENTPAQDHEAQTYLYLGNMLADKDPARARTYWQQGLTRHPNSAELRAKLNN
ncbi:MAG: tetratricopeptide (TPR) repeat protein [Planctomycetota bacterium]|jgi:tetratricopeptide (TPR) repeat protein